jgi:hypothetical protein
MHLLLAALFSLAAPDAGAHAVTDAGWKGYEGTFIVVSIPPDWSFTTIGDDGFKPPASAHSTAEVTFMRKADKDPSYVSFDRWLADRGVAKGKPIKVGRFRAMMAPVETSGDRVVARTYIAVPYLKKKGGAVRVFQLSADKTDPMLPSWTAIYEKMLKSLKLYEKNAPAP